MNLKVLALVFLCLLGAFVISNLATATLSGADGWSFNGFTESIFGGYSTNNGVEPTGDPIGGGGWPSC